MLGTRTAFVVSNYNSITCQPITELTKELFKPSKDVDRLVPLKKHKENFRLKKWKVLDFVYLWVIS